MKKGLLFSLMATFLAGIWFGGVSLASTITFTFNDGETPTTIKTTNDAGKLSTLPTCSWVWYKDWAIDWSWHVDKDKIAQIFTSTVFSGDATYLCNTKYVAEVSGVQYETFLDAHAVANGWIIILLSKITTPYILGQNEILQLLKPKPEWYSSPTSLTVNPPEWPYLVNSSTSGLITTYTVAEGIIKYTNSNNVVSYLSDIPSAFSDGTYKLLQDINRSQRMTPSTFAHNVTLDLNGHTIVSTATDFAIYLNRAWTESSHRIFNVIDTSTNKWWKIIAMWITAEDSTDAMISLAWKYNDVTVWEWVTLSWWCIAVLSENQMLSVNWTINWWDDFAIATNGSNTKNPIITINVWSQLFSKAAAVYFPSEWTLTINWWKISGAFWVVARAWTTTISNDVIFDVSWEWNTTVWDQKDIQLPKGKAVIMDVAANYPWSIDTTFAVNNASLWNTYLVVWTKDDYNWYDVSIKSWENIIPLILTKDWTSARITEPEAIEWYQWYNVADENNKYVFDFSQIITGDTVIEPIIKQYTVKFDANAEWVDNPVDQTVNHGATASEPEIVNTWNILLWWYLNDNKFDFTTPITADITLTWKWEAISDSTWGVEAPEGDTFTWVILGPEEPALSESEETNITVLVASSNSTAEMEWVVELKVYSDYDGDGILDAWDGDKLLTWKVNFTSPKVVRIPVNTTWDVLIKVRHNGETDFSTNWLTTDSGATCSNWVATPAYTWTPITPNGWYVEIYTCSASTFVAYTEKANQSSSSTSGWWRVGGWGGGSSSSYSCKSLPTNAVANNTSKPKKDTNYSYSTDTGAVCTFQCKAGYTRNEKNEKCEKSSETLTDTDKEGTEKVDTTDTSDTAFEDLRKVLDDGYNVEFHNAYNFAFKNGITTMLNIQEADMEGPLTRIAMAKMLSQYAINVLKKTPDTTKTISFPDVSAELDAEYNNGVTLAYQLWIMWINIENFRPDDLVTRAEFVTALSRMLFGLADGENLYYETHMQKLLDENIITVDNPNMHELRGYVMIMLMRSVKNN